MPVTQSRRTATVAATHLNNKHAYRAQKKGKAEADLAIDITKPVKANKDPESKKVYEESATTKTKPTTQLESSETWREYGFVSSSPSMTMMHREEPGLLPSCEYSFGDNLPTLSSGHHIFFFVYSPHSNFS